MGQFKLHGDYDHDGKISFTEQEYALRSKGIGISIIPNLDIENRRLPGRLGALEKRSLDFTKEKITVPDNELAQLVIEADATVVFPVTLQLTVKGISSRFIRVSDEKGNFFTLANPRSKHSPGFLVNATAPLTTIFIEAGTCNGSPGFSEDKDAPLPEKLEDLALLVELVSTQGNDSTIEDICVLTIAPLVFASNSGKVKQVYIAEIPEEAYYDKGNTPAVQDFIEAASKIKGLQILPVDKDLNSGDSWFQDQFQEAYAFVPSGKTGSRTQRVIVHLPRLRADINPADFVGNLATVVEAHFPSQDTALFNHFWTRRLLAYLDGQGQKKRLTFHASYSLFVEIDKLYRFQNRMKHIAAVLLKDKQLARLEEASSFPDYLFILEKFYYRLKRGLARKAREPGLKQEQAAGLTALKEDLTRQFNLLARVFQVQGDFGLKVSTTKGDIYRFDKKAASDLDIFITQLHQSGNYGGNIEASPPQKDAPFGKLVIGSTDLMDKELVHFLRSQLLQPVVELDTSWLDVGHVDEIITLLPDYRNEGKLVIGLASPRTAFAILRAALAHFEMRTGIQDVLQKDPDSFSFSQKDIVLTHLFRGKHWWYKKERHNFPLVAPPKIYYSNLDGSFASVAPEDIAFDQQSDWHYLGHIKVTDLINIAETDNLNLHKNILDGIETDIQDAFPEAVVEQVPVCFDFLDFRYDKQLKRSVPAGKTSAYTPNCVNMQVIDKQLFIPRPFGPRMFADDACAVLKEVMAPAFHGYLVPRYLARNKLNITEIWMKTVIGWHIEKANLIEIAEMFQEGFPGLSVDEIANKIRTFKGNEKFFIDKDIGEKKGTNLREGWHKIAIPDGTVDLFEACIQITFAHYGYSVNWIDAWYYHVRSGQIHCGTNVIHQLPVSVFPPWWN